MHHMNFFNDLLEQIGPQHVWISRELDASGAFQLGRHSGKLSSEAREAVKAGFSINLANWDTLYGLGELGNLQKWSFFGTARR